MPITSWPSFTEEEAQAVSRVLLSNKVNYWTGNEIRLFEQEFAEWTGVEHAVALANGTLALELSLLALGIGEGDEVIVTPRSFVASASCILRCGAIPVFADVDPDSQNITAKTIETALTEHTKAIICVHMAGWPCDIDPILSLAHARGVFVVEDCAQAHGALYKGHPVGGLGHIAAWSFCQDKIMTTGGEGGMVTTNDVQLAKAVWSLKEHGKTPEALEPCTSKGKGYRWLHDSLGINGRMTEMQAAIGRIQLGRVADWVAKRQANMQSISSVCSRFAALRIPDIPQNIEHAGYRFYLFVEPEKLKKGWSRDRVLEEINALGVPCFTGACPELYREALFESQHYKLAGHLYQAKRLGETSLAFPIHPSMSTEDVNKIKLAIQTVMDSTVMR
ncbi:DegT/DnrJ/EryC1/StrS aminotransferase family protein [Kistimonas asteriae]|uniref:DegT/DnrJ/EryC1/StrS family aminotransferase n=1 Tax=Kistimonas asteriae TaxID=517724 RepID=UPI0031B8308D